MKRIKLAVIATLMGLCVINVSCSSSGSEGSSNKTEDTTKSQDFGDPTAPENIPSRQKEGVVSYGAKLLEVPAGRVLTPATIRYAKHPVFIEFGKVALDLSKVASGDLSKRYEGKAEFLYVRVDNNPSIAEEFGVKESDLPVVVVADSLGEYEKFVGLENIKAKAEEKLKTVGMK